jgi:hypothetical protein
MCWFSYRGLEPHQDCAHAGHTKTDAANRSYGICRVIDASRSPSPDPRRSGYNQILHTMNASIEADIQIGDVVRLKSGGLEMTVTSIDAPKRLTQNRLIVLGFKQKMGLVKASF